VLQKADVQSSIGLCRMARARCKVVGDALVALLEAADGTEGGLAHLVSLLGAAREAAADDPLDSDPAAIAAAVGDTLRGWLPPARTLRRWRR
jgi:hypothetical protein